MRPAAAAAAAAFGGPFALEIHHARTYQQWRRRSRRVQGGRRCGGLEAARDIAELRSPLDAFNEAKTSAWLTIVRMLVTGLVLALLAGAFLKLKVFGGGP